MLPIPSGVPIAAPHYGWFLNNFFLQNTIIVTGLVFCALLALVFLNMKTVAKRLAIKDSHDAGKLEESGRRFIQGLDKELVRELASPQFKLKIYRVK